MRSMAFRSSAGISMGMRRMGQGNKKSSILRQMSGKMQYSGYQKFPFETGTNDEYIAERPNSYYQEKRPGFKGATYSKQQDMPSLPIPELKSTLDKYLKSIKPFCQTDAEYEKQIQLCYSFLSDQGPALQERLLSYSQERRNWMQELWDSQIYLGDRSPVVPFVSYFYGHKPLPTSHRAIDGDMLVKATAIISSVVKFVESLKDEALPAEVVKGKPFCMNGFQYMFNNSRVPQFNIDTNHFYSIYEHGYLTVAYKDNFFKVYTHDKAGAVLSNAVIYQQLNQIVNHLGSQGSLINANAGIGALTTLPRDEWAGAYQQLQLEPVSSSSLETIHKSSFVLCLDQDTAPITLEDKSRVCWHGDGTNRFFDKPLQFFVTGNGFSGFLAEHSKMDGTPTLFLNHYVVDQLTKLNPSAFVESLHSNVSAYPSVNSEHLPFIITPTLRNTIESAKLQFITTVEREDLRVWHYNRYGKRIVKTFKVSPDAYIQQVIQLAVFKYLKKQLPTYEAASTRAFFQGRTETGRPVTESSSKFVKTWESPTSTTEEKIAAFYDAAKDHVEYLKMASNGEAVDRHFFGLKNMVHESDEPVPLFQDALFKYSSTWLISTSQLSSENFECYGWSQVYDNGFGLAYMINNEFLHINITNKPEASGFSVDELHYYLTKAADEMYETLSLHNSAKAKL
ncbi:carnitine O-acetyltransferase CAT2 [Kluyveromyces lactis]|uniref:Carnitine O-acetyltransferase, mitochondrial n=1 Tax=Kluyveromyces lactis (strain ATCC 8585 / CBS 2359 / DSM 70799 / NBRC 1267 / NRRL Y-1140 / WM37) TaxID=284590 RepID=Q6CY95_KLULA|nr:uncharacterized protein KLLA0_A02123g [Kluyveromyces lactis]CAH02682.1 KLLA0A02123p [Kluyveromyces lactis]|eukprot:XP_451094.1 uncharacterized protein KLLA0_A02123g [Kluyveromyces lactis]